MKIHTVIAAMCAVLCIYCLTALGGTEMEKATFAGGCFWCMQPPYDKLKGVQSVVAGYTGGKKADPTYEEVSSGKTGHREAVLVTFDPAATSYKELLEIFWKQVDPTDALGQFADRGSQYRTAVYYHTEEQRREAEASKKELERSGKFKKTVATEILKAEPFYKAEDYHQNYYKTNSARYQAYKKGSGRQDFIERTWGKDELKKKLTPLQYHVTQECGTEPAFNNEYWNNKRKGIYVDIVTGKPLFSSADKFESGTGWPSFTKPIDGKSVEENQDNGLLMERTEVKSSDSGSHLGHVFSDGPAPTGRRYCINSSALRFIPEDDMEKEGYGEYKKLLRQ